MPPTPAAPSEMLSGPDLGGGYLHQLSLDRLGEATTFTHHAQDGGDDAGGPPLGDLAPLGFAHPESPCMFGGPRCWHRRYLLPFASTQKVRAAYVRQRFVLETTLRQLYAGEPVPFREALRETLARIAGPLRSEGTEWYVAGSAAVALLGGGGSPMDIDLGTTREGVDRLGALLADYLIEPVAPTDWPPGGRLVVGARAFVGTPRSGSGSSGRPPSSRSRRRRGRSSSGSPAWLGRGRSRSRGPSSWSAAPSTRSSGRPSGGGKRGSMPPSRPSVGSASTASCWGSSWAAHPSTPPVGSRCAPAPSGSRRAAAGAAAS